MKCKRHLVGLCISIVIPTCFTLLNMEIAEELISKALRISIIVILLLIDAILIVHYYRNSEKERNDASENKIKSIAYSNSVQLGERKRDYIINETYGKSYNIPKDNIPYDVHNYIAEICRNFRDTVSQITSIPQEYMAVTFIYHYVYPDATDEDQKWRWLVGKESSIKVPLDRFVERENSLYHYIINGTDGYQVNIVFCNEKKDLAYEGHYYMSARDKDHNKIGSVFAVKVIFGNNATSFVEGILLVSTYGIRFVERDSDFDKSLLKHLLIEGLYPFYQRLLETELGVLYLRHEKHTPKKMISARLRNRPKSMTSGF